MTSKAAQHSNDIISLTILVLMVVALISGQAAASKTDAAAVDVAARYEVERRPLERMVDSKLDPIAGVLTLTSGPVPHRKLKRTRRPTTR